MMRLQVDCLFLQCLLSIHIQSQVCSRSLQYGCRTVSNPRWGFLSLQGNLCEELRRYMELVSDQQIKFSEKFIKFISLVLFLFRFCDLDYLKTLFYSMHCHVSVFQNKVLTLWLWETKLFKRFSFLLLQNIRNSRFNSPYSQLKHSAMKWQPMQRRWISLFSFLSWSHSVPIISKVLSRLNEYFEWLHI